MYNIINKTTLLSKKQKIVKGLQYNFNSRKKRTNNIRLISNNLEIKYSILKNQLQKNKILLNNIVLVEISNSEYISYDVMLSI